MAHEKEQFRTEYFSGLNRGKAELFVNKDVECSRDGHLWYPGKLVLVDIEETPFYVLQEKQTKKAQGYHYIRTTPKSYGHPTITIAGGWKLPKPEIEAPEEGTRYFVWGPDGIADYHWEGCYADYDWLKKGIIHLKESRAQAWADWWRDAIIKAVQP